MPEDNNLLTVMNEDFQAVTRSGKGEAYSKLSVTLEAMENELCEYAQKLTLNEMKAVLERLKNDEPVSGTDLKQLKSWIVGDAEYYIKTENNFDNWNAELQRVIGEIKGLWTGRPDVETLLKLRGLMQDAIRTVADIFFFVQQKERVEKFNAATKEIGQSERTVLVSLLEQKISSSRF